MDPLWSYLFKPTKTKEESQLECLAQTALFAGMPPKKLKKILRILHEREYQPDETIFRVGEPGVGMYIILEGEVVVKAIGREEEERIVATITQGQTIGDLALLEDAMRSATVVATKTTRLLGLIRPELMDLIKRDPALGCDLLLRLLKVMGERLLATNETLAHALQQLEQLQDKNQSEQELEALISGNPDSHKHTAEADKKSDDDGERKEDDTQLTDEIHAISQKSSKQNKKNKGNKRSKGNKDDKEEKP